MHFVGAGKLSAWFPPDASFHASEMDSAFFGIYVAAVFAVVLVVGLAIVLSRVIVLKSDERILTDIVFP